MPRDPKQEEVKKEVQVITESNLILLRLDEIEKKIDILLS